MIYDGNAVEKAVSNGIFEPKLIDTSCVDHFGFKDHVSDCLLDRVSIVYHRYGQRHVFFCATDTFDFEMAQNDHVSINLGSNITFLTTPSLAFPSYIIDTVKARFFCANDSRSRKKQLFSSKVVLASAFLCGVRPLGSPLPSLYMEWINSPKIDVFSALGKYFFIFIVLWCVAERLQ